MDAIRVGVVALVFGGLILAVILSLDTTAKVDAGKAEVLAQIAEQEADMAAFRNGGKADSKRTERATRLRERADKIAAEADAKKATRDSVFARFATWFRNLLGGFDS